MKIWMVRHGLTNSNVGHIVQGSRLDDVLNEEGKRQAKELAESIQGMQFDVIFSSPLKRAAETARIIAQGRAESIILRNEIKERDFGTFTGRTFEEVNAITGDKWNELEPLEKDEEYYQTYGRERSKDFKARLLRFVADLKENYPNKRILIVAHGGIIRLSHLLFKEMKVDHVKNASIEEFEV